MNEKYTKARKLGEIAAEMQALWYMPDQAEAQRIANTLLVEALRNIAREAYVYGGTRVTPQRGEAIDAILDHYDTLTSGVRYGYEW